MALIIAGLAVVIVDRHRREKARLAGVARGQYAAVSSKAADDDDVELSCISVRAEPANAPDSLELFAVPVRTVVSEPPLEAASPGSSYSRDPGHVANPQMPSETSA